MAHTPFSALGGKHRLSPKDIVLTDDTKLTSDESDNLMFNVMRVLVFKPVPLRVFIRRCMTNLSDKFKELSRDGIEHYNITIELVELSSEKTSKHQAIVSRFSKLADLQAFITTAGLHLATSRFYGVRLILVHYVPDCFLHKVVGYHTDANTHIKSNRVNIIPVSLFACGKYSSRLLGTSNTTGTQNILIHIPHRFRARMPSVLFRLDGDAKLYWLPTMQQIKPAAIPDLIRQAYYFHTPDDLKFPALND